MKESKIVIIGGMSGSGKSTTAQQISKLYDLNGVTHEWYHEEMANHPIRWANGGEFKQGDCSTEAGMQKNITDMFLRWSCFLKEISAKGQIYVLEGCLFQNIIRYFFPYGYPNNKILDFYDKLFDIFYSLETKIIFLSPRDVEKTLKKAFATRGKSWEKLILDPADEEYFKINGYKGDESIYSMWQDYQILSAKIFENYQGKKLKLYIDHSDLSWQQYHEKIASFLNLKYIKPKYHNLINITSYCGDFYTEEGKKLNISVLQKENNLYLSLPWFKFIKMIPIKNNLFELAAFPTTLTYTFKGTEKFVKVEGNYDWDINGQTFYIKE